MFDESINDDYIIKEIENDIKIKLSKRLKVNDFSFTNEGGKRKQDNKYILYSTYLGQGCALWIYYNDITDSYSYESTEYPKSNIIYETKNWNEMCNYVVDDMKNYV